MGSGSPADIESWNKGDKAAALFLSYRIRGQKLFPCVMLAGKWGEEVLLRASGTRFNADRSGTQTKYPAACSGSFD